MRQGPFANLERKRRGVGVSELMSALNISSARFSKWVRGEIDLEESECDRAADAIGLDRATLRGRAKGRNK